MDTFVFLVIVVVLVALVFDFTNGFHDAANAIATVVATKAMNLKQALVMAAALNILGAFFATQVAQTIEHGIITNIGSPAQAQIIVLSALAGAILWNVTTWWFAMPSSSSHAIVGGLVGAGVAFAGRSDVVWANVVDKVVAPMLLSPLFGLLVAFFLMMILAALFQKMEVGKRDGIFKKLQILAGGLMAFSHGSNDAQKTMGVITIALVGAGLITHDGPSNEAPIPWWVILLCAVAMGLGTYAGGQRIIETTGKKITALQNESGFAANIGASITILLCSRFGLPVSTTHVVVGGITGSGLFQNKGKIQLGTWKNMALAWLCTLPGSAGFSLTVYLVLERFLLPHISKA